MPHPTAIMDVANTQMRAGRYKYAASRGESELLDSLSAQYTKSTGRPISTQQFIFLPARKPRCSWPSRQPLNWAMKS